MTQGDFKRAYDAGSGAYREKSAHWSYWLSLFVAITFGAGISRLHGLSWFYRTILIVAAFFILMGLIGLVRRLSGAYSR
jgi:hypothetical protein